MAEEYLLSVQNVSKKFCKNLRTALHYGLVDIGKELIGRGNGNSTLRRDEFWAVKDVSFQMKPGEGVAILGRNGAGKSTLMKMISGRLRLDRGEIRVRGKVATIHELGAGFSMIQTGRENVYNAAAVYGLGREQAAAIFDEIVDFAEIKDFIDTPVANYSTGMKARLGYAIIAYLHPDLFILDEVLAVGDVLFKKKCLDHLVKYREMGKSLIMATHDLNRIQSICNRVIVMELGEVIFSGPVLDGINFFLDTLSLTKSDLLSMEALVDVKEKVLKREIANREERLKKHEPTVVIENMQIESVEGTKLTTSSDLSIVMDYSSKKAMPQATWGFSILTPDGQHRVTGGFAGFDGRNYSLNKGLGKLSCTVLNPGLSPGEYHLQGTMIGRDGHQIARYRDPVVSFSVESDSENLQADKDLTPAQIVWH